MATDEPTELVRTDSGSRTRTIVIAAALVAVTALTTAVAVWRSKPDPEMPLRKFDVLTDVNAEPIATESLSPDGAHIGYVVANHLWIRDLDQTKARDLGPVKNARWLVWSPDSRSLAYASGDGTIRRVPVAAGSSVVVCDIPESRQLLGLQWIANDLILAVWRGSLYRVDARGGTPQLWAPIDAKSEIDFHALTMLPDGRAVFATHRGNDQYTVESWDGEKRLSLLPAEHIIETDYSNSHLLLIRDNPNRGLWAIPIGTAALDPARAFLIEPTARGVSASREGSLLIASSAGETLSELAIFDRQGKVTKTIGTSAPTVAEPSFSPDGQRVALMRGSDTEKVELWVNDTAGGQGTRLTFGEQGDGAPGWDPSGERVIYADHFSTVGSGKIVSVMADGSAQRRQLVAASRGQLSGDGKRLLYEVDERGPHHLRVADVMPDGSIGHARNVFAEKPEPDIRHFALSPDGHLLAYVELTGDHAELFVTRFPSIEGRWQPFIGNVEIPGERRALRWTRDTHELVFPVRSEKTDRVKLMSVSVVDAGKISLGEPVALFETDLNNASRGFDISPDGKSVVMPRTISQPSGTPGRRYLLVQRWLQEFQKK